MGWTIKELDKDVIKGQTPHPANQRKGSIGERQGKLQYNVSSSMVEGEGGEIGGDKGLSLVQRKMK